MNNQPNAEELLKEAQTAIIELSKFIQNNYAKPSWINTPVLQNAIMCAAKLQDAINTLESSESSSTVTAPLTWEEALEAAAWENGSMNWRSFVPASQDIVLKEAALLFMRSHTNHALANFTENHATQIISPEK